MVNSLAVKFRRTLFSFAEDSVDDDSNNVAARNRDTSFMMAGQLMDGINPSEL